MKLLLGTILTLTLLSSCQSEYERQIELGKLLIQKESRIVNQLIETHFNDSAREELVALKKELLMHAELSGNKDLFLQDMASYRSYVKNEQQQLITKYP